MRVKHPSVTALELVKFQYREMGKVLRQYEWMAAQGDPGVHLDRISGKLKVQMKRLRNQTAMAVRSWDVANRPVMEPPEQPYWQMVRDARKQVRKMYVSRKDRLELENSGVSVNPMFLTTDRSFQDYGELAVWLEMNYPSLGVTRLSDIAQVASRLFVGRTSGR